MKKSYSKLRAGACLVGAFLSCMSVAAQQNNPRYPARLPDWFWDSPATAHLLSSEDMLELRHDTEKLNGLFGLPDKKAAYDLKKRIAEKLGSRFTRRDLSIGSCRADNHAEETSLAVQIDPDFSLTQRSMLCEAASRFMRVALDEGVIRSAFERSVQDPDPVPQMYELKDGEVKLDELNRKVYGEEYADYLLQRIKPISEKKFTHQLRKALGAFDVDSAVLMISSYSGNAWWGGAYYDYYSKPEQQLSREVPAVGYFYIRLNVDKMKDSQAGWDDPDFWASKIAHEMLHNLGYWHPSYRDPEERDRFNSGRRWAFIVAYENAILARLRRK